MGLTPPFLWQFGRHLKRRFGTSVDYFRYAPDGWATSLPADANAPAAWAIFMDRERELYERLVTRVRAGDEVLTDDADERMKYLTYGYTLALLRTPHQPISVLDYGANLGDYYWLGRALVPEVTFDYHCADLPDVAAIGRAINSEVTWHTDDGCLDQPRDLVMFSSSIQYLPDWQAALGRAAQSGSRYLLLSDVAIVRHVPTYVSLQRSRGLTTHYAVLNRSEIIDSLERAGLQLVREFPMGPHPAIANAPEQPTCAGWLFERVRS